ncbi:MAG: hypothetical protein K5776_00915 [Lachnospiraceae bacterium]|nr:hypothetical protein [Lachnospiraceae bacterium]
MVIQTNIMAANAQLQYNIVEGKKAKSTEKLSSGYRINRAADDAAGLAISERMRKQIRGLTKATTNCQDGVSLVQIADGALNEVHDMINRGTELSMQAANGTLSDEDRSFLQLELDEIKEEINAIREKTYFNEIPVLKGDLTGTTQTQSSGPVVKGDLPGFIKNVSPAIQAGHFNDTYDRPTGNSPTSATEKLISGIINFSGVNESNITLLKDTGFNLKCATCNNHYSIKFTDDSHSSMKQSGSHYIYNIPINGVSSGEELIDRIIAGTENGNPRDHFTVFTKDSSNPAKMIAYDNRPGMANPNSIADNQAKSLVGAGVAYDANDEEVLLNYDVIIQAGFTEDDQIKMKLPGISTSRLGIDGADISTQNGAINALEQFSSANDYVSGERSRMGAYQNRLEHTISNLENVVENTQNAESQIRDTDMATEMVAFSKQNILAQVGTSMMSQANHLSDGVMSLLQ